MFSKKKMFLAIFMLTTSTLYLVSPLVGKCLKRYNRKFTNYSSDRQQYIIKNIMKSTILALLCPYGAWVATNALTDKWDNNAIRLGGAIYASTDALGFILIPDLPATTLAHHTIVILVFLSTLITNFQEETVMRGFVAYTFFSALTFAVNFYLGCRFLIDSNTHKQRLAFVAAVIYTFSLLCNWMFQIHIIVRCQQQLIAGFYTLTLLPIIFDDIILLNHLVKSSVSSASVSSAVKTS